MTIYFRHLPIFSIIWVFIASTIVRAMKSKIRLYGKISKRDILYTDHLERIVPLRNLTEFQNSSEKGIDQVYGNFVTTLTQSSFLDQFLNPLLNYIRTMILVCNIQQLKNSVVSVCLSKHDLRKTHRQKGKTI